MPSIGRLCPYCSKPISSDERIALCDRCCSVQHEDCWDRNGRCSTFRCAGMPRTMVGADVAVTLEAALNAANSAPSTCPFCSNRVYAGLVQGRKAGGGPQDGSGQGLLWVQKDSAASKGLLKKLRGGRKVFLPGAHLKGRSCGKCRQLFLWGVAVDDSFVSQSAEMDGERYCPHCSEGLDRGVIVLEPGPHGGARFECDDTPEFHKDWLGHQLLDRFVLNKWNLPVKELPARNCPSCRYTEVAGRPIYRFL